MKSKLILTTIATILSLPAFAKTSAVNVRDCNQMQNTHAPFIVILNKGDDLLGSISQCAKDAKLKGAMVSALGQVQNPTLAYFTSNPDDKPTLTTFNGFYELASLIGNVSHVRDQYYTHIHGVLADKEFHGIAGHFDKATVGLTVEVSMTPLDKPLQRAFNEKTGFGMIQP